MATLKTAGLEVLGFSNIVPTPFVPFSILMEDADFGIMITASHNPAADNGYKAYAKNGCQVLHVNGIPLIRIDYSSSGCRNCNLD